MQGFVALFALTCEDYWSLLALLALCPDHLHLHRLANG